MGYPRWMDYCGYSVILLIVSQVVLWPVLGFGDITWLVLTGIPLLLIGVAFLLGPVLQFRREGGVAKGESYANTTVLVDAGFYAIVRHPQYLALPMLSVAFMFIVQRWVVVALGVGAIVLFYLTFHKVDELDIDQNIDKFGEAYREYRKRVPAWNPVAGVWRWGRRRTS